MGSYPHQHLQIAQASTLRGVVPGRMEASCSGLLKAATPSMWPTCSRVTYFSGHPYARYPLDIPQTFKHAKSRGTALPKRGTSSETRERVGSRAAFRVEFRVILGGKGFSSNA